MNASTFAQLLLLWQRELHRLDSFLQLHLAFRQFPVQLHLGTSWPPPMLSSLAAVLRGTTLAMFTSSGFRNDVIVGENWFRLYTDSGIPVAQPDQQKISISKIRTKLLLFWSCLKFTCTLETERFVSDYAKTIAHLGGGGGGDGIFGTPSFDNHLCHVLSNRNDRDTFVNV